MLKYVYIHFEQSLNGRRSHLCVIDVAKTHVVLFEDVACWIIKVDSSFVDVKPSEATDELKISQRNLFTGYNSKMKRQIYQN